MQVHKEYLINNNPSNRLDLADESDIQSTFIIFIDIDDKEEDNVVEHHTYAMDNEDDTILMNKHI